MRRGGWWSGASWRDAYEIVEAALPAVLTVVREINRPRYPTVPMRLKAEEAEVALWDNKVMQLDETAIGLKGSPYSGATHLLAGKGQG